MSIATAASLALPISVAAAPTSRLFRVEMSSKLAPSPVILAQYWRDRGYYRGYEGEGRGRRYDHPYRGYYAGRERGWGSPGYGYGGSYGGYGRGYGGYGYSGGYGGGYGGYGYGGGYAGPSSRCAWRHPSYNWETHTYIGYDGLPHWC